MKKGLRPDWNRKAQMIWGMKALPDEEGIETHPELYLSYCLCMKALPDEEGIETIIMAPIIIMMMYEGTP